MRDEKDKFVRKAFTVTWVLLFAMMGIMAFFLVRDYSRKPDVHMYIGKSAYEVAADNGFKGTEKMWLDSLKAVQPAPAKDGVNGKNGKDGKDSISTQIYKDTVVEKETIVEKETPVKGDNGQDGRTPEFAKDDSGNLYTRYVGDDDWWPVQKVCVAVPCKEEQ